MLLSVVLIGVGWGNSLMILRYRKASAESIRQFVSLPTGSRFQVFLWSFSHQFCSFLNIYYFTLLRVFHSSVSWWSSTGVWVTASLLKFPGLFSVFWSISYVLHYYSIDAFIFERIQNFANSVICEDVTCYF